VLKDAHAYILLFNCLMILIFSGYESRNLLFP